MKKKEEKKSIKKSVAEVSYGECKKSAKKSRSKKHVKMATLSSRIIGDKDFMTKVKESSDLLLNDINAAAKKIAPYIKGIVKDSNKEVKLYVERLCGDIPADYNAHRDIFDSFVGLVKMMILDDMERLESISPVPENSTPCSNEEVIPDDHGESADSQTVDPDLKAFYDHMTQHQVCETDNGLLSVGYASKDKLSDLLLSWGCKRLSGNFDHMYDNIINNYTSDEKGDHYKFNRKWFDLTAEDWSEYLKSCGDKMFPDIIDKLGDYNLNFNTKLTKGLVHIFLRDDLTDGSFVLALNDLSDSASVEIQVIYLRMVLKLVTSWILDHSADMMFFVAKQQGIKHVIFNGNEKLKKVASELKEARNLSNYWDISVTAPSIFTSDYDHDNTFAVSVFEPLSLRPYYLCMKCSERLLSNVEFVSMMDSYERSIIFDSDYFETRIATAISKSSPLASGINDDTAKIVMNVLNLTEESIQAILLRYADLITEFITGNGYETRGWTSLIRDFIVGNINVSEFICKLEDVYDVSKQRDLGFKVNNIMYSIYLWFDREFYGTSRVATYLENACEKETGKN